MSNEQQENNKNVIEETSMSSSQLQTSIPNESLTSKQNTLFNLSKLYLRTNI